jgi:Flp pilus assembly secretin CpaC
MAALAGACCAAAAFATPTFKVTIDQAKPLTLSAPAAGIVVGNPSIVGVSMQSDRLLFVTGRSYGVTNLIVVGANGRPIYESQVTVTPADNDSTVVITRGLSTVRNTCNPICRTTPDISDDPAAFDQISKQVGSHAGQATGAQ